MTVVAVLLAALNVTVNCPSSGPVSEPSPPVDFATLTVALSLSVIVPVALSGVPTVICSSPAVTLPSVTTTVSLSSTRLSSVVGTVIVAVVALAAIVTLVVVFV